MNLLQKLWNDDLGVIISAELILVSTIMVLGLITGMTCLQEAIVGEFKDLAGAFSALDQSYYFKGMRGCFNWCGRGSRTFGSAFSDNQIVSIPDDADIVPCPMQPVSTPTPTCPLNLEAPIDGVPCDPCQNLPLDQHPGTSTPFDAEPAGPQPIPGDAVPTPAGNVESTSVTQVGPRFPY
ncbi:MAG: hypothetical protein O2955_07980 [Planctomycetota bacterium]|nr:hypothetical protein [Planctomycetota bacterium]MDA1212440.1 hypothetical protein [Planctomycetota bacterium]